MSYAPYVDPIEHACRHCNPRPRLPSVLVQRAALSGLALRLYSTQDQLVADWSGTSRDIQYD